MSANIENLPDNRLVLQTCDGCVQSRGLINLMFNSMKYLMNADLLQSIELAVYMRPAALWSISTALHCCIVIIQPRLVRYKAQKEQKLPLNAYLSF